MVQFSRSTLSALAATGALVALVAADAPARAEDNSTNLGPVGPREPILVKMGDKRMVAYLRAERRQLLRQRRGVRRARPRAAAYASTRIRVALHPGELFHLDGVGGSAGRAPVRLQRRQAHRSQSHRGDDARREHCRRIDDVTNSGHSLPLKASR